MIRDRVRERERGEGVQTIGCLGRDGLAIAVLGDNPVAVQ